MRIVKQEAIRSNLLQVAPSTIIVMIYQKLQWSDHVAHCILMSSKALTAIRLIRRFFTTKELLQLVTSNFFSIIYYNSEIWHLPSLKSNLKNKLLSSSAKALKTCIKYSTNDLSFVRIHAMCDRAIPEQYLLYKHAILLYSLYNAEIYTYEWVKLNFAQILTSRQTKFMSLHDNKRKVGLNSLANRLFVINNRIPFDWLKMSFGSYKVHCKKEFLKM